MLKWNQFLAHRWILIILHTNDSIRFMVYMFLFASNHVGFRLKRWCNHSSIIWLLFFSLQIFIFIVQMSRLIVTLKWWHQTIHIWNIIRFEYQFGSNTFTIFNVCFLLTKLIHSTTAKKELWLWPISIFLLCFYFIDYDYHNIYLCNEL